MAIAIVLAFVLGALFATFMMRLIGRPEPVRKSEAEET